MTKLREGILLFILIFWTVGALAHPPQSKTEYCFYSNRDPQYFLKLAADPNNRLAKPNRGGLLGQGVCWWHSLFQRSSIYLGVFRPGLHKPNAAQARTIIYNLAYRNRVVEIPGYANLYEFSSDWWNEIQHVLELWQISDGFLKQRWRDNLKEQPSLPPALLRLHMDELYNEVETKKHLTWTMLKLPGIAAHAWLILRAAPVATGYELDIIDSRFPRQTGKAYYYDGAKTIHSSAGQTVPYIGRTDDFAHFERAHDTYCNEP